MIPIPSGIRVWIATGHTDMRRGMQSLALTVQESLKRDPHAGDLYIFRGRRITPLDAGKADNFIILIVFKDFRAPVDHFLHPYPNRFGVEGFDWYKPWRSLHDLFAWQDARFRQGSRRPKAYTKALGGLGKADELPIA